jgi:hypothetical protein
MGLAAVLRKITIKGLVFSPGLFTAANPTYHADIGEALTRFLAAIIVAPVAQPGVLIVIDLKVVHVFFVHGAPRKDKKVGPGSRTKRAKCLKKHGVRRGCGSGDRRDFDDRKCKKTPVRALSSV